MKKVNKDKWIYVGVFLDEKSKNKLKSIYKVPKGWKPYFDHMTVTYNNGSEEVQKAKEKCDELGEIEVKLKVVGYGISDKAFAVKVEKPSNLPCTNEITHITLAVSPTGKPVDSNYIEKWERNTINNLYVTGILKTYK